MLNSYSFPSPLNSHLFPCEVKIFPPFQFLPSPLRENEKALKPSSSPSVSLFPFDCRKYLESSKRNQEISEWGNLGLRGRSGGSVDGRSSQLVKDVCVLSCFESRSRQPVKHYKKLLSEIFPKSLCEKYVKPKDVVGAEEVKSSDEKLSENEYAASDDEEIAGK